MSQGDGTAQWRVPLSDLLVEEEHLEAAREAIASGWWSMGPRVAEFERAFSENCDGVRALAVANGTAALHLALLGCGCGPGDEVVVPSLTFVAAANAVAVTGATPVFCDIVGERDLNVSPADVESALSSRTRAIVVVHYAGFPCDMEAIRAIADARGIAVVEDAAHAVGGRLGGRACGTLGTVGCFSFFSNKNLAVGEGGMIVTGDDDVGERIRLLRSHGMTTLTWDRHRGHAGSYDVVGAGFNYRLDEVHAALGLVQLRRLHEGNVARERHWRRYRELLDGMDGIVMPFEVEEGAEPAYHIAVVLLPPGADREHIRAQLAAEGIQTSVHYPPIHTFSAYAAAEQRPLPETEAVANRLLTLPLYPHMDEAAVELVSGTLRQALAVAV